MKIKSVDKLMNIKRIRRAALHVLKTRTFKEGYSYPVTQGRLQGQYNSIRRSLAIREVFEGLESLGLVRLDIRPDDTADMEDLKGDCYNPDVNPDISPSRLAREEKEFEDTVNRDGVYGLIGEYRTDEGEEWNHADSCWGFVGEGYKDSGYDTDIMSATISALESALSAVCPHCGRPARKGKRK